MIINHRIKRKNLTDILEEIERFEDKMKIFMSKYKGYSYELNLEKNTTAEWIVDLTIEKDEYTKTTNT